MIRPATEETLRALYALTGISASILDRDFHTVCFPPLSAPIPCAEIHRDPSTLGVCKACDVEHLTVARNTQEPLFYVCPFGVTEAIVPILRDDAPVGYLFASLGVEAGKEEEVARLAPAGRAEAVALQVAESKRRTREELTAAAEVLRVFADYLAGDDALAEGTRSIGELTKRYVKNHLAGTLSLREIARSLHCSTVTLTEHFRAECGTTVSAYVTKKRMERAEVLLLTTDDPLCAVAAAVGFSDVEYFSRTFRKFHGEPPARWRRKRRGESG